MSENRTRLEVAIWMKRLKRARKFNRTKLANTQDTLGKVWSRFGCVKSHGVKGQMRQVYALRMFYVSSRKPSSEKPATEHLLNMSEPRGRSHLGCCCPPSLWANLTGHPATQRHILLFSGVLLRCLQPSTVPPRGIKMKLQERNAEVLLDLISLIKPM